MKKYFLFILAFISIVSYMNADTYIKVKSHTDSYYYDGFVHPAEDSEYEIWIGDKKMSLMTTNRITIVDINKNQIFIINRNEKNYVEAKLPVNVAKVVPERNLVYPYSGTVKKLNRTKKIEKWNCNCYLVNSNILWQKTRQLDTDTEIWVTTDVPFNLNDYHEMNINIRRLEVLDKKFLNELKKIKGFCVFSESKRYFEGFSVKSYRKVIEMTEKTPPFDVYSIPPDLTKKNRLS